MPPLRNIDDATLTVSSSAVTLEDGSPTLATVMALGANQAVIVVQSDSVYWSEDGNDATSGDAIAYAGDVLQYMGAEMGQILKGLSFLQVTGAAALKIKYYAWG